MLFYFGLLIVILAIVLGLVSYKLLNKKPIDDTQKPINYQEQLKEMLEKSTNQSKYKLNIEFDIDLFTISEECFNYDDTIGKYDVLSPSEIMFLQSFLCKTEKESDK